MNYKTYITSSEWRDKHKEFLKRSHYRCSMFPFIIHGILSGSGDRHSRRITLILLREWLMDGAISQ